jgi:hypothetical protein
MIALDHVFLCCSAGAPEAAALARLGLIEGSANTHPGQGTACRRFFFANAYIELIWVSDPAEAQGDSVRETRLWERWSKRAAGACPFGIVLRPAGGEHIGPPFATWSYRPEYLPEGVAIELATGTPVTEPEIFYFAAARRPDELLRQPLVHALPVREVTGLRIGIPGNAARSAAAITVEESGAAFFSPADTYLMTLSFDLEEHGQFADLRPELPLVLRW